ncbi:MAG: DoxX family protein [Bacteroidota bacterium]
MNALLNLGKYLYAVPFAIFGIFHFAGADAMAGMAPGGVIMVYFTGICLLAASVSMLIGKYDKLATTLLGVMLILFAAVLHSSSAMAGDATNFLKDIALAGAAWMYAANLAKDKSIIG